MGPVMASIIQVMTDSKRCLSTHLGHPWSCGQLIPAHGGAEFITLHACLNHDRSRGSDESTGEVILLEVVLIVALVVLGKAHDAIKLSSRFVSDVLLQQWFPSLLRLGCVSVLA